MIVCLGLRLGAFWKWQVVTPKERKVCHGLDRVAGVFGGRVAYLFRVVLLALLSLSAYAADPPAPVPPKWGFTNGTCADVAPAHGVFPFTSGAAAAQAFADAAIVCGRRGAPARGFYSCVSPPQTSSVIWGGGFTTEVDYSYCAASAPEGPFGSSAPGALTIGCESGLVFDSAAGGCLPDPTNHCVAGKDVGLYAVDTGASAGGAGPLLTTRYMCDVDTKCGMTMTPDIAFGGAPYNNPNAAESQFTWHVQGPSKQDGATCDPAVSGDGSAAGSGSGNPVKTAPAPGVGEAAPSPCSGGKVPGQVNGVTVCVTPGPSTPAVTTKSNTETKTNPDGSTAATTTTTNTTCNAQGACSSTTSVTVVTTPAGGGAATTTTSSSTKVCTATDTSCRASGAGGTGDGDGDPSSFSGSCTASFKCEGDAVMCATARATNDTLCALKTSSTAPEHAVYASAVTAGTATAVITTSKAISSADFDQSNALGVGESCIGDQAITVAGRTVVMELSRVCPYVSTLGNILLAISFLVAMRIVFRND